MEFKISVCFRVLSAYGNPAGKIKLVFVLFNSALLQLRELWYWRARWDLNPGSPA